MSTPGSTQGSQRERVYAVIRDRLILQQLPEGERLSEPEWARRLSVSRTAVREAFARLEAEGLIRKGATAGYVVPVLTLEDVREILEVRLALESAALEAICGRGDIDLTPLATVIQQHADFIEHGYRLGASEADRRFHQTLIDLAGNRRLADVYRRAPLPLIHRFTFSAGPPSPHPVEDHRAIVEAMREGDADRGRQLLRAHLYLAMEAHAPRI